VAAVVAAACFATSAVCFWALSQGRLDLLVALAVLPAVSDRLDAAYGAESPARPLRFSVGLGASIGVGVAFLPGILPAIAVLALVQLLAGRHRGRGLLISLASVVVAAALVFPLVPDLVKAPAAGLSSHVGTLDFSLLTRLAPGTGPGSWPVAWFLPVAALVAFSVVGPGHRARAWRAVLVAVGGLFLAWASAAGRLPEALTNAPAYVALSAVAEASVVGYGLASIGSGIERQAFGYRQVAAGGLAVVLFFGLSGQAFAAASGGWQIGPNGLPPAWPVIAGAQGPFRILWLGRPDNDPFPAPGGDPQGILAAGSASVRYAITGQGGVTALDTGRGGEGSGYAYARRVLTELLTDDTSHAGALLSPLGVRFVVAAGGDLPEAVTERLNAQLDLDRIPVGGLVIYENARAIPLAFVTSSKPFGKAAAGSDLGQIASIPPTELTSLTALDGGFRGTGAGGLGYVAWQDAAGWRVEGGGSRTGTEPAFGWAIGFEAPPGTVTLTYADQWIRTAEMWVLALLWLGVLWTTRRPVSA
jgi:hypothetical protein